MGEKQINITHSLNTLHNYGNRIYSNAATKIHQQFGPSPSPGNKIVDVLDELTLHYPELRKHLRDADGSIPSFINIFVNEDDIRTLEQEQTLVKENAVISIVPAIAGGIKHPAE